MLPFILSVLIGCSGGAASVTGPADTDGATPADVSEIRVEPSSLELRVGDSARLEVKGRNGKGKGVSVSPVDVRWSSSDSAIASVDSMGMVRARGDGVVLIDVAMETPGKGTPPRDSARVRSSRTSPDDSGDEGSPDNGSDPDPDSPSPDTIHVSPSTLRLETGETAQLEASVEDAQGSVLDVTVTWDSEDPSVATVNSEGVVEAVSSGDVRIVASTDSARGGMRLEVSAPPPSPTAADDFRAFPGAEGWGAEALMHCDRSNMQVLRVTNLRDSGAGSLRDAIDRVRGDVLSIVLFEVAGYIDLESRIEIRRGDDCLYIAGQSAPGDGITIRAWDGQAMMLRSGPLSDIVIRYLRFRNGTNKPGEHTGAQGIIVAAGEDIVLDHLSFSWTSDQLMSLNKYKWDWGPLKRLTLQRSLLAEPLASSPVCYTIGGDKTGEGDGIPDWYDIVQVSFHHNAAIHCSHRTPIAGGKNQEIINNVVYNWNQGAMHSTRKSYVDYIGNYFKPGPMNPPLEADYGYEFSHRFATNIPRSNEPDGYRIIGDSENVDGRLGPTLYLSGNVGPHNSSGGKDNWAMVSKYWTDIKNDLPEAYYESVEYADVGKMPISVNGVRLRRSSRLPSPPIPVSTVSAFQAWNSLIEEEDIGANRRLSCDGGWVDMLDGVDKRVLREARNGTGRSHHTGQIASHTEVGGFPDLDAGVPCKDADGDGMPDKFESRYGLDAEDSADARHDPDGDGYTNLEEFLNGTVPR